MKQAHSKKVESMTKSTHQPCNLITNYKHCGIKESIQKINTLNS